MKAATRDLFRRVFSVLKPPPDMTLSQWADEKRVLSKKSSAEPGRWKTSKAPYQREIMDAISDVSVQKVVVMSAAQIGKTDGFILNTIGYYMDYDPSPIMVMQPNLQTGESFSKDRLSPMIQDTPALREKVSDKTRNSGNTILHKEFPGGHITIVGANSPSGLRSRPIRILLADEIDGYPPTAGKDGDPLLLASKRLTTFWNKKEVFISTPTVKGESRIEIEFENSTQEVWNVPCPACGEYQALEWGQVIFDKNNLDEINYTCEKCGTISSEVEWKELFIKGKFFPRFPERTVRGFYLNSLASLFVEWREIVEKFLVANEEKKKGNIEMLKAWTNTEMAQTWEEEGSEIDNDLLYNRREKYNCEVPDSVLVLTAGIDTQDDRFEIEVVGWGADRESWGIKYQIIYGDLDQQPIWDKLDAFLNQTFIRADGSKLKIIRACLDVGGHYFNQGLKFCKKRLQRGIYPIRGRAGFDVPYIPRPSKNNREQTPLFTLGVDTGKALIYQALAATEEGANYCHFPKESDRGYTEDYFKGLTAERMVLTYTKGKAHYVWRLKENWTKRNEPLDCRNYARAALEISGVVLKKKDESAPAATGASRKRRGRQTRSGGI
ncbi:MAG: phage terminase large subunit family protein [Oscillospiraceae bacterium]|nr:phage terminase large subunit family protein [Oscillospiraceae bacterium]